MTLPRTRLALSTLALSIALSGCASPSLMSDEGTRDDPRYAQLLDLIDEALKSGMAVVLVADLTPHPTLGDALAMTKYTTRAIWMNEAAPQVTFSRSFQTNSLQQDTKMPHLFKSFEVHILPPGKYLLTGGDDYKLNALLDEVGAQKGPVGSGRGANGTSYLSPELYREFYKQTTWQDASYGTQTKTRSVCTAVHAASGACVSWGEQQQRHHADLGGGLPRRYEVSRHPRDQDPVAHSAQAGARKLHAQKRPVGAEPAHALEDARLPVQAVGMPRGRSQDDRMPA